MRRREFFTLLGAAGAAWPVGAWAQSAKPVIGFVHAATAAANSHHVTAFSQGLKDTGYVVGEHATVEYDWAEGQYERLPGIMDHLVRRRVAVIVTGGGSAPVEAAKAATQTIPIVFVSSYDPVQAGLVASLNRPGGNITGITFFNNALAAKRLELLHELLPTATVIAFIVNPKSNLVEQHTADMQAAALKLGKNLHVLNATTAREIDSNFDRIGQLRAQALLVASDPFLGSQREHCDTRDWRHARLHNIRRHSDLCFQPRGRLCSSGCLRWSYSEGRKASRSARYAADKIRACHQPQDREGARHHRPVDITRPRRRGARIGSVCCTCSGLFLALSDQSRRCDILVAIGAKRTSTGSQDQPDRSKMTQSRHRLRPLSATVGELLRCCLLSPGGP
jgi:putative tryptophan/tyrosine transport system substrate-binding protein